MPHWADKLHLWRAIGIIMREANLGLEVTALGHKKSYKWLLNYFQQDKGMANTYFIEGVLGSFVGHVPQEQIIVIF